MTKITLALALALLLAGCTGFDAPAPEGFAAFEDWFGFRAVSPDGVTYRVRTEDNEPEAELPFWKEALKKRMLDAGYAFVGEADAKLGGEAGYLLELAAPVGQEDYSYLVAIGVRGDGLLIAEAAGEVTRLAKRREAIVAAMQAIR